MKIIIIGAQGYVGKPVVEALAKNHDVIKVGNTQGDYKIDICDLDSIKDMYKKIGAFDALVSTTGKVVFKALNEFTQEDWQTGLHNKLMGQVNLVLEGLKTINDNGSFTLTSGILNCDPIKYGASAAMINGAVEGFVRSANLEMPRGIRINAVSPTLLKEAESAYGPYFSGYIPVAGSEVAMAYLKSVEGLQSGQIYKSGWHE